MCSVNPCFTYTIVIAHIWSFYFYFLFLLFNDYLRTQFPIKKKDVNKQFTCLSFLHFHALTLLLSSILFLFFKIFSIKVYEKNVLFPLLCCEIPWHNFI